MELAQLGLAQILKAKRKWRVVSLYPWSTLVEAMRRMVTNLKRAEPRGIFSSEAFKPLRARTYIGLREILPRLRTFPPGRQARVGLTVVEFVCRVVIDRSISCHEIRLVCHRIKYYAYRRCSFFFLGCANQLIAN